MSRTLSYCKLCGSERCKLQYRLGEYDVYICLNCGVVYVDLQRTPEEVKDFYAGNFYEEYLYGHEGLDELLAQVLLDKMPLMTRYRDAGRILDVGCAQGRFLSLLDPAKWERYGVEIAESQVSEGRRKYGLNIVAGELKDARFLDHFFDLVTCWDVIEHVHYPADMVREISRILKPEGVLAMKTPNDASLLTWIAALLYRLSFGYIRKPLTRFYNASHINSFSPDVLAQLLERNGLTVVSVMQEERYFTRFCLDSFNPLARLAFRVIVLLSELLHRQAAFTIYAVKESPAHD